MVKLSDMPPAMKPEMMFAVSPTDWLDSPKAVKGPGATPVMAIVWTPAPGATDAGSAMTLNCGGSLTGATLNEMVLNAVDSPSNTENWKESGPT